MEPNGLVRLRLADVEIDAGLNFERTVRFLKDYLAEAETEPDFSVTVTPEDLEKERALSETKTVSDAYLETLALYRQIAEKMPQHQTILMHGSVLAMDGDGYMFTAKSGTGKSTHARLWREVYGDRVKMINDDKPLLKLTSEGITAYGTPWNGKHRLGVNTCVKLKAIAYLTRAEENRIETISPAEMLPILLQQIYRPEKPENMALTMNVIEGMMKTVRFYRLGVNMSPEAARVAFEGMRGDRQ